VAVTVADYSALNSEVAEKILGWTRLEGDTAKEWHLARKNVPRLENMHKDCIWVTGTQIQACKECGTMPDFVNDLELAWTVVGKMWQNGFGLDLEQTGDTEWRARFRNQNTYYFVAKHEYAPTAICLSALLAVFIPK
jgi:hypothetical protein